MRRLLALLLAAALLMPFSGVASGAGAPAADTALGPHAFGRFLIGPVGGDAIGWVTLDVRPATAEHPDPGVFLFERLPGVPGTPATTRAAITWTDFYRSLESGFDALSMGGFEVLYFGEPCCGYEGSGPWTHHREFWAGFFDVGNGIASGDFFRWANTIDMPDGYDEFVVMAGTFTVDLGPAE